MVGVLFFGTANPAFMGFLAHVVGRVARDRQNEVPVTRD